MQPKPENRIFPALLLLIWLSGTVSILAMNFVK
jgi:hypothetical protein